MITRDKLIEEGYKEHGPYGWSELGKGIENLPHQKDLEKVLLAKGGDMRGDMKDYPTVWMIYVLYKNNQGRIQEHS